jgi:hypothetical protein
MPFPLRSAFVGAPTFGTGAAAQQLGGFEPARVVAIESKQMIAAHAAWQSNRPAGVIIC